MYRAAGDPLKIAHVGSDWVVAERAPNSERSLGLGHNLPRMFFSLSEETGIMERNSKLEIWVGECEKYH